MSTKSFTLDREAGYTTEEIERYHDQQERSARLRRRLLGSGAVVAVAGCLTAVALLFSSGSTPAVPAAPVGPSTSATAPGANPAVPSHPDAPSANPAVPSRPDAPAVTPAVPSSPAQGAGTPVG